MILPLQLAFLVLPIEVVQLIFAERAVGVARLRSGTDPRDTRDLSPWAARLWALCLLTVYAYPLLLLVFAETRWYGAVMLAVGILGYELRRRLGLRYALVVLTFEGAIRIGVVINMFVADFGLQ